MRRFAGMIVVSVAAAGLLAAPAGAKIKIVEGTKSLPEQQGEGRVITAKCPKGSEAVSGGWRATNALVGPEITESSRASTREWSITAVRSTSFPDGSKVTLEVYCDTREPGLEAVIDSVTAVSGVTTATAECAEGSAARSGGFKQPTAETADPEDFVWKATTESRRLGDEGDDARAWQASWADFDSGQTLEAIAYCGKPGALKHKQGSASLGDNGSSSAATATTKKCKRPANAGGFLASHIDNGNFVVQRLVRKGQRWSATGIDFGHLNDVINVYAFCP
jgi:hypothetical protein